MKTFLISIPKSGTYLMREFLSEILVDSHIHITRGGIYDYSKVSVEEGRINKRSCFVPMTFANALVYIPDGSFGMGHLSCSHGIEEQLKGFRLIFIKRGFEECARSGMNWLLKTGRSRKYQDQSWVESDPETQFEKFMLLEGDRLRREYNDILKWKSKCSTFDYNEILRDPDTQIKRLGNIFNMDIDANKLKSLIGKKTLTRI